MERKIIIALGMIIFILLPTLLLVAVRLKGDVTQPVRGNVTQLETSMHARSLLLSPGMSPARVEAVVGYPPGYYARGRTSIPIPGEFDRSGYYWWVFDTFAIGVKYSENEVLEDSRFEPRILVDNSVDYQSIRRGAMWRWRHRFFPTDPQGLRILNR